MVRLTNKRFRHGSLFVVNNTDGAAMHLSLSLVPAKGPFTNYIYKKVVENINFYKAETVNKGEVRWSKNPKNLST